jgi:predicted O-methyltransferase YrrM
VLVSRYPQLIDLDSKIKESKETLMPIYKYFKTHISKGNSAASIEISAFLDVYMRYTNPTRIVDLGSGFSSYVLRRYQADKENVEVWSVDSSKDWLEKTKYYLQSNNLNTKHLYTWDEFSKLSIGKFSLIFLDERPIERRVENIARLRNSLTDKGALVIDDVHKDHLRLPILKQFENNMDSLLSLRLISKDELGRYSIVIHK